MKRLISVLAAIAVMTLMASAAMAITVQWQTGGAFMQALGQEPGFYDNWDTVCLSGLSGTLNLTPGVPVDVVINELTFGVGVNASVGGDYAETVSRDMTPAIPRASSIPSL